MPHIRIDLLPKELSDEQMQNLVQALNDVAKTYLGAERQFVSIDYQELPTVDDWKTFYKQTIEPNWDKLAQQPLYDIDTL